MQISPLENLNMLVSIEYRKFRSEFRNKERLISQIMKMSALVKKRTSIPYHSACVEKLLLVIKKTI